MNIIIILIILIILIVIILTNKEYNNIIIGIIIILIIIIVTDEYTYGNIVGLFHRNKLKKSAFTYIDMRKYSKNLDSPQFINGYLNAIK